MPLIRLTEEVHDALVEAGRDGESVEDTIVRLTNITDRAISPRNERTGTYTKRAVIMPLEFYSVSILELIDDSENYSRFQTHTDSTITARSLQDKLKPQWDKLREQYPADFEITKNGRERWLGRIGTALAGLQRYECITKERLGRINAHGSKYSLTDRGRQLARRFRINSTYDGLAYSPENSHVEPWEYPLELIGQHRYDRFQKMAP